LVLVGAAGCFGPVDVDCELSPPQPKFHALQDRYALGSRATIDLRGVSPFTLESSDPSVVRVERVGRRSADLSFVGPGQATLALENENDVTEQTVEVVPHETFMVVLSDVLPIPIGRLSDATILAGHQYFLVLYLDSNGERLNGLGLADFGLSPRLELCDDIERSLEYHCLSIVEPGLHALEVTVGDERLVLPFRTVIEADIVGIELLHPDEEDLLPGTWVQVDVVGVTEDGTHVASVHPRFEAGEDTYFGYFAYQYDPSAEPQTVNIDAIDHSMRTEFRGVPSEKTVFGCASSAPGKEGPLPAVLTLLGLVLLIRHRSRDGIS
jgi:MYXO-CTERM domain-containing protein